MGIGIGIGIDDCLWIERMGSSPMMGGEMLVSFPCLLSLGDLVVPVWREGGGLEWKLLVLMLMLMIRE